MERCPHRARKRYAFLVPAIARYSKCTARQNRGGFVDILYSVRYRKCARFLLLGYRRTGDKLCRDVFRYIIRCCHDRRILLPVAKRSQRCIKRKHTAYRCAFVFLMTIWFGYARKEVLLFAKGYVCLCSRLLPIVRLRGRQLFLYRNVIRDSC